ncbi:MAG: tol-pal system protein YbgF [Deltaproteobacteria bacterium]|nr:tol-pal system protein YbgF [Deltaproteobacteria bacterium]
MSMRIIAWTMSAVVMLVSAWGCTVEYRAAPVPYDRAPLTEREWAVLNGLKEELDKTRKQLADTRAEVDSMRSRLNAAEGAVEEIRSGAGPGVGAGNMRELQGRLAALETEVKSQRELLKVREDELRLLRDAVLKTGEAPADTAAREPATAATQTAVAKPTAAQDAAAIAQRDYEDAWKWLRKKDDRGAIDYSGAIEQFKKFLEKHPDSNLADNAQYWIGESYYALQNFDQAIVEFDLVRKDYPKSDKVPAAWLKIGYSFAELGNRVDARLFLQEVISRFPQSKEAEKAQDKIRSLDT